MRKSCFWVLLIACQTAFAADLSFADAKARSCNDEAGLPGDKSEALLASQAEVMDKALSTCPVSINQVPSPFVVVVELDASGLVRKTWRSDDTGFVRCFEDIAAKSKLFSPPFSPFYTSFEVDLRPSDTKG